MRRSTKSFLFPDVNVWLALTYEGHVHHLAARKWFEALPEVARLFFCRVTQLGLLRLLSTEAVMGNEVLSQSDAWMAYDRLTGDARISFLAEPPELDEYFRTFSRLPRPAPKDWADSYLAAFVEASNLNLVTFDRALHRRAARAILL